MGLNPEPTYFKQQVREILKHLPDAKESTKLPLIVAVSGFGGSGKSTLAGALKEQLESADIVSMDAFIVDRLQVRSADWEGFDRERFREQVLEPASRGETINFGEYDWIANKILRQKSIFPLPKYLILEGCSILHPDLVEYYDFSVWIDCPLEVATQRGMARDRSYSVDHDDLWLNVWMPNERDYYEKVHPDKLASYILSN